MGKEMIARLANDICRCTGEAEMDSEVRACHVRNECLRYLERQRLKIADVAA